MIVIVDVGRDSGVVVIPLLSGDDAVAVAVAERGEELDEDLLGSHLSTLNLGVLRSVVDDTQVSACDGTIAIGIELSEALVNDLLSCSVGGTTKSKEELVVADDAVFVGVEVVEKELSLVH